MSPFRKAPVLAECLMICLSLFVVCQIQTLDDIGFRDAQRQWGAVLVLPVLPEQEGPPDAIHRQLIGPIDVWDGEWWRIPASAMHHPGLLWLLASCTAAWILGWRLEQRWGSLRFLLFLGPAILVPLLVELLIGQSVMGFSGVTCAMLGALMVVQNVDPHDDDLPEEAIRFALGVVLLGLPATAFHMIQVPNAAHISGILYGWFTAQVFCRSCPHQGLVRAAYVVAHLALVPAIHIAMSPVHDGRFLWYLAQQVDPMNPLERESLLKQSVSVDPSLTGVWLQRANLRIDHGELQTAWTLLLEGLSNNPGDVELFDAACSVWRRLPHGEDRTFAEAELKRVFGNQAATWSRQIRNAGMVAVSPGDPRAIPAREPELNPRDFPLDQPIDLQWNPPRRDGPAPLQHDPDRPDGALEGRAS